MTDYQTMLLAGLIVITTSIILTYMLVQCITALIYKITNKPPKPKQYKIERRGSLTIKKLIQ